MKKIILVSLLTFSCYGYAFAAGSSYSGSSGDGGSQKTNYAKAVSLIKSAKKLEQKGKKEKTRCCSNA